MRTGLVPNSFPTAEAASTPLDAPRPPENLRRILRREAALLADVTDAARRGDTPAVLRAADHLGVVHRRVLAAERQAYLDGRGAAQS